MKKTTKVLSYVTGVLLFAFSAYAGEITIGTGLSIWSYPLSTISHDARTQTIYLASEVGAAKTLDSLDLNVSTIPGQTMTNFTIRLKHTDLSAYGSSPIWESSDWTTVYQTNHTISTTGWEIFHFTTPFTYNGTQNLMVDISFNNASSTSTGYCRYTSLSTNRSIYYRTNSSYGDPLTWTSRTPTPNVTTYFPNIQLGYGVRNVIFNPAGGTYNTERNVVITCPTSGATIHYTTNGLDPTESDPTIASGSSVLVDQSMTLKAKAWREDLNPSDVKSAIYQIVVATPVFSVAGGTYNTEPNVVITCPTQGAAIHYTTNGLDPTESDPVIASGSSLFIDHALTLKAKAWKGLFTPSNVTSADYQLVVATPAFSVAAGTYNTEQNVVITCATPGTTIRYTLDGSDPNNGSVYELNTPILIDHSLTLIAVAKKEGFNHSVTSAAYQLVVATPVFNPNGGVYESDQMVVIACATPEATIHYTTTGLDPTQSDPVIINGGTVSVTAKPSTTLKARAFKTGWTAGNVKTALYYGPLDTGSGTTEDPYRIATKEELLIMARDPNYYDKSFILTADIDLEGQVFNTSVIAADPNQGGTPFSGLFDGNGYKITNFSISGGWGDYFGLFGQLDPDGVIANLGLENCTISGNYYTGALVGRSYGVISNCYSTGSVTGSASAGSLVGYLNLGFIVNCYSTGAVNNGDNLTGVNSGGTVSHCYSIEPSSSSGYLYSGSTRTSKTVSQMQDINTFLTAGWDFIDETTNGTSHNWFMPAGALPVPAIFEGYTPPQLEGSGTGQDPYRITDAADLGTIWYRPWAHYALVNDIDPNVINPNGINWGIAVVPVFGGVFEGNNFYLRSLSMTGTSYLGLFGRIRSGGQVSNLMMENVSISSGTGGYDIGCLAGQNHGTISNCSSAGTVSGYNYNYTGGLVGTNYNNINNCHADGTVSGFDRVGGVVGENFGTMTNCDATSSVISSYDAGGVAGRNNGSMNKCHWHGTLNNPSSSYNGGVAGLNSGSISQCFSSGEVRGYNYVGGLVGFNYYNGSISDSYSTCSVNGYRYIGGLAGRTVNGGIIIRDYSTGAVSGTYSVGGLVGAQSSSSITNSFWNTQTSGQPTSAGGTGKTTAEMKTLSTFTSAGWDFTAIWDICEATNYPRLQWQIPETDWVCPDGVNVEDLDYFVGQWLQADCDSSNDYCDGVDINTSGKVDLADLTILAEHWLSGDPTSTAWVPGKTGNALSFNGVSNYVDVPGYKGINGTASRTCSAWIKPIVTGAIHEIMNWGTLSSGLSWQMALDASGKLVVGVASSPNLTGSTVLTDGSWHHVAAILSDDGSPTLNEVKLYVDGKQETITSSNTTPIATASGADVQIGSIYYNGQTAFFTGLMDDVRIYNRALSAGEIVPEALPETGLVTHWTMDEVTGTVAHDSVSSYDGVLTNF